MIIFSSAKKIHDYILKLKKKNKSVGFVPTMGYLHNGHLSLMRRAKRENDISVISIFVNPIQFAPHEDFKKYPRDFKRDERLAKSCGVDIIFYPTTKTMYPQGYLTYIEVRDISDALCGASRPGHFKGVATVVAKLLNIVGPDIAYFGQKDVQQARIITKMAEDLNMPSMIKILPTVRCPDGLAMSSRNFYLSKQERQDALVLNRVLRESRRMIKNGVRNSGPIISSIKNLISSKKTAKIDYVKIVDPESLLEFRKIKNKSLIALAVWFGKTRLIDNTIIRL
ncbi:MAG: pantoate--beta-alanine ligase [Candidatus Omnitrophota bacterium]